MTLEEEIAAYASRVAIYQPAGVAVKDPLLNRKTVATVPPHVTMVGWDSFLMEGIKLSNAKYHIKFWYIALFIFFDERDKYDRNDYPHFGIFLRGSLERLNPRINPQLIPELS